jgi:hypothetical protein
MVLCEPGIDRLNVSLSNLSFDLDRIEAMPE